MNLLNQLVQIFKNFGSLGRTRLMILGGVGVASIAIILAAALLVNKPAQETLYVGLETPDLNQISMALAEANIDFQVGADGSSITVPAGMTGKARLPSLPNVPTARESGVKDLDAASFLGLMAPAKTPKPVLDKINAAVNRVLQTREVADAFNGLGMSTAGGSGEEFGQLLASEMKRWTAVAKTAGVKAEQ